MALLLTGAALLASSGCKNRQESAKQDLKESGYDMTPEAFFRAAESDDVTAMERLVAGGIAVDTRNSAGDTALHAAAAAGMKKSADFLLDHKIPVDVTGAEERTPLMVAVMKGTPSMVRYLLSQKADPLRKDPKGYKPLMLAVKEDRSDMIAELAPYDRDNLDTALLLASLEGKSDMIDKLTAYGASIYARTDDGRTPLMLAAQNGNIEAVEMLVGLGANRFSMDEQGRVAADMAREAGHEELAMRLAEEPGKEEFGIEEPADLGAEMLAQVEAHSPASGQGKGHPSTSAGKSAPPPLLDGVVLESSAGEAGAYGPEAASTAPLKMRAYRQKELPLRVESVHGDVATVRMAGGGVKEVSKGAAIPGSKLTVVRLERKLKELKDSSAGASEVSVVEVRDPASGRSRELVSGIASTAHDPVALVEDAAGHRYVARAGQKFQGADGAEYTVIDVRPNQMVIENHTKGEVITVPLRGPRG
jgi:ankyrin repeat protein